MHVRQLLARARAEAAAAETHWNACISGLSCAADALAAADHAPAGRVRLRALQASVRQRARWYALAEDVRDFVQIAGHQRLESKPLLELEALDAWLTGAIEAQHVAADAPQVPPAR